MRPEEGRKLEEGSEQVIRNEGHGIGEGDPRDAHNSRSDEEAIVAVTGEVRDKGAPKVQHGVYETGRVNTTDHLQVVREAKSEDKGGKSFNDEDTLCLSGWKHDVHNNVYSAGHWIHSRSGQPIHEQSRKRALDCSQLKTSVPKQHLERVPTIRLRSTLIGRFY